MITMTELARLAGVSQAAVSLTLNHPEMNKTSPETKARILELAEKHHFHINQQAALLRRKSSRMIGIILPLDPFSFNTDSDIICFLYESFLAGNYEPLFSFYTKPEDAEKATARILSNKLDGILAYEKLPSLDAIDVPKAFFGFPKGEYDSVEFDLQGYAKTVMKIIRRKKYTRILTFLLGCSRQEILQKSAISAG